MSSVQSYKECPQCKYDKAIYEFELHAPYEFLVCPLCGYDKTVIEIFTVQKNNGNLKKNKLTTGTRSHQKFELKGFGAYKIAFKNGKGEFGSYTNPYTEETIETFRRILERPDVDAENSYLTRWNDRESKVDFIFGKPGD